MFCKTHIKVGAITAMTAAILIPPFNFDEITTIKAILLSSTGSILTSQVADIDALHSKISQKFKVMRTITQKKLLLPSFALLSIITLYLYYKHIISGSSTVCFIILLMFGISLFLCKALRHRKVTHTLLFNLVLSLILIVPYYMWFHGNTSYVMLYVGMLAGLYSHLFYDCLTRRGCPLFAPLSKKSICLLHLKSGRHDFIGETLALSFLLAACCLKYHSNVIILFYKKLFNDIIIK